MIILWDTVDDKESFDRKKERMFNMIQENIAWMKKAGANISEEICFYYADWSCIKWNDLPENLTLNNGQWFGVGIADDGKDFTPNQREAFNSLLKQTPLNTKIISKIYNERK